MTTNCHDNGHLLQNEKLDAYTTWRVGGIAKQLYKPKDRTGLAVFLRNLPPNEPLLWLGLGSNALIRDTGFRGTVIVTQNCLKNIMLLEDNLVFVEAGVSCATMARFCARHDLEGGEFWAGIPGTMGGALRMNAGCSGSETWQFVESLEMITREGERMIRYPTQFEIGYRQVIIPENEWFLGASFRLKRGSKAQSLARIKTLLEHRAQTQPTSEYNCGSVFRNPPQDFAARLIEKCGLKGYAIGGAVVSEKHANFIINREGKAVAKDIETLIQVVRDTVFQKEQVQLIQEVHIIGDNE